MRRNFWQIIISLSLLAMVKNATLAQTPVVINEFLIHPGSGEKEWVELYNPDDADITSFWIDDDSDFTDDAGSSSKKTLAGAVRENTTYPYLEVSSVFNNDGDKVVLFDNDGNILDEVEYVEDYGENAAIGRSPDGSGEFQLLQSATKGAINSGVLPTPTPTSAPTPTPTKTPTPTRTPTPAKVPTPKRTPTPLKLSGKTSTPISTSSSETTSAGLKSSSSTLASSRSASLSAKHKSVLGTNSKPADKEATSPKNKEVLVEGATKVNLPVVSGGMLLIACAILVFLKKRSQA